MLRFGKSCILYMSLKKVLIIRAISHGKWIDFSMADWKQRMPDTGPQAVWKLDCRTVWMPDWLGVLLCLGPIYLGTTQCVFLAGT